jgi:rubredoxin
MPRLKIGEIVKIRGWWNARIDYYIYDEAAGAQRRGISPEELMPTPNSQPAKNLKTCPENLAITLRLLMARR